MENLSMDGVERIWEAGKRTSRNVSRSMRMSGSGSNWGVEDVFARSQRERFEDDEEALRWAALEKLPTYDRLRTSIIMQTLEENRNNDMDIEYRQVDVRKLGFMEKKSFIDRLIKVADEDNEKFLWNLRNRIDRVGIQLPTVEVRFQQLTVDAECYVGSRALPTLWNTAKNLVEYLFGMVGLTLTKKINLTILKEASGVLKPSR